ncbi:hypothetical protein Bpfe_005644 [Biomphalaria pfeifferi]|uniref:PARP catalytic domain-containing protein n=1 Tax=Biomphalaria pfeifferi TaxID=112525 RepID=A0AAD8C255_BIOPF|nr:hypothetical protein Bpfe_005644 [Biomphalaria pfeifferi]
MQELTNLKLHRQLLERVIHVKNIVTITILVKRVITGPRKRRPSGEVTTTEALWELELAASYTEKLRDLLKIFHSQKEAEMKRKIKRLLDLKTAIDGFLQVIDKIIDYYKCKSVGVSLDEHSLPKLEEHKEQKEKMDDVTERLKLNKLLSIFANYKDDFMTSDESILCALLGLINEYQNYLKNLDDKVKNHQDALYYIGSLLEEREHDIEYDPNDLKTTFDVFLQVIDKINHYTCKSVGLSLDGHSLPKLEELKEQKEKLNKLLSKFAKYKFDFMTSDESILCTLLGLDNEYQSYLENLDEKAKNHHDDLYYILSLLVEREHDIEYDPNDKGIEGLCKNLVSLGFTEELPEAFAKNIPPELIDLQTPSYWAERYLEHTFVYHPLLSANPRYPYSETTIDGWFEQEILTEKRKEPNRKIPSFNVRMFNCTPESSEDNKVVRDYLQNLKDEDKDSVMLYHGTTHDNAESILTWGITIGYGKDGQDFSSGDGFYLSEKLEDAIKWSRTARGERNAILVFKIKKDLIDPSKENGLDVTEDKEKWQNIVKLCRTQYNDQKVFEKLLKDITFIRGHICLNPIAVAQGKDNPDGFDQSELHICIRDKDYAVRFGSLKNICCVIFY